MAKNYILEPMEWEFNKTNTGYLTASLETTPLYGLTLDELKNLIPDGAILDINNGDKFIVVAGDRYVIATRDGTIPEETPDEFAQFYINSSSNTIDKLLMISAITASKGTYSVSIYTETEDADPYPVKNFTYKHAEVAKNDIEDIIQAIYTAIEETESQSAHGYSPADRLVIAVAKLHRVDPETALTTGNYPNQMKRIAAIIRDDFGHGDVPVPDPPQ